LSFIALTATGTVRTGFSASFTVTFWVHVAELPAASVAVQVIVVLPTGYGSVRLLPSPRFPATVTPGLLSAVAAPGSSFAEHVPASVPAVTSAGQATVGGVPSTFIT